MRETLSRDDSSFFRMLPHGVVGADNSSIYCTHLSAEEQKLANCYHNPLRRRHFILGRLCAKLCLAKLGLPPIPILKDDAGAPIWPDGVVGSISHSHSCCVAVAASSSQYTNVGVDIEYTKALQPDLWPIIFSSAELAFLASHSSASWRQNLAARMFTAKEAFYKCQFPITQCWIDFKEVEIHINGCDIRFESATSAVRHLLPNVSGRCIPFGDYTITIATLI